MHDLAWARHRDEGHAHEALDAGQGDHQDIAGAKAATDQTPEYEADRAPDTQDGGEEYQGQGKPSVEERERIDHKPSIVGLRVVVVKAVRAPVAPAFVRRVLVAATAEPAVGAALARRAGATEVTVRITGDRELRRLNRQFLGDDRVTDVLSFPSEDLPSGDLPSADLPRGGLPSAYLGDLALSWPAVRRQAQAFGHGAEAEAALLTVHGFLHLLGWDHETLADEREMTRLTLACLARSDVHPVAGRL